MYDTVSIVKGGVYELLDKFGKPYEQLYLVVSDNQYNTRTDFVMVCTISPKRDPSERDVYHVPFDMINKGMVSKMDILSETLFNVSKKRLTKYKFSLNENIMKEVAKKLQMVIFGQELYTLDEAIVKLYYIELDKKLQYLCETPTTSSSQVKIEEDIRETSIDVSYDNMSIDDMQKAYAHNHKEEIETDTAAQEYQEEPQPDVDSSETKSVVEQKEKEKRRKPIKKRRRKRKNNITKEGSRNPGRKTKYEYIYTNYQDFLLDYYGSNIEDVMSKYNIFDKKVITNLSYRCRLISKENKDDIDWIEFANEKRCANLIKTHTKI